MNCQDTDTQKLNIYLVFSYSTLYNIVGKDGMALTKQEIGQIPKQLRINSGKTQKEVADLLGRNQPIVGHWESGYAQPDANTLFSLCKIYGVSVDEAFGFKPKRNSLSAFEQEHIQKYRDLDDHGKEMVDIVIEKETARLHKEIEESAPIISLIKYRTPASAGRGIPLDSVQDWDRMEVISNAYTRKADYCISVSGNSMEPKFYDGDMLLVKEQDDIDFGEVGVFLVNGEGYIKQKGEHYLISLNRNVPNVYIGDGDDIVCEGLVIGILDPDWIKK